MVQLVERGADPLPQSSPWAKNAVFSAMRRSEQGIKVLRFLLQAICARGVSLEGLQSVMRLVQQQTSGDQNWKVTRVSENAWWRRVYPVH